MANHRKERLVAKLFLEGTLTNTTQLSIGSGTSENADQDIIRLNDKPYIPGSSLAGSIKSLLEEFGHHPNEHFWGNEDHDNPFKSHAFFDNCLLSSNGFEIDILDGIKIDPVSNQTQKGAKYDYEVLQPGALFAFRIEVSVHELMNAQSMLEELQFIKQLMLDEELQLGSCTTAGLGYVKPEHIDIYVYDFIDDENAFDEYFNYLTVNEHSIEPISKTGPALSGSPVLQVFGNFKIKSRLITAQDPEAEDTDHIQLNRKKGSEFYLTGKSIKGAIHHRMIKIENTLGLNGLVKNLFGFVEERKVLEGEQARKARIFTRETVLQSSQAVLQMRNKIDRFSGGTIDQALFSSMPAEMHEDQSFLIQVKIKEPQTHEVFLLLQVMKDLMISDMAIGGEKNVGRGILEGLSLQAEYNGEKLIFENGKFAQIDEYFKELSYEPF
ncbi:RAMP superfamily CRISPR-associated protein [Jiulongibacter sediminis]|uniref:RAMP superfamily CRISPR-associated protein n=1 Tax=Jiulongibacter sediminis TaxID=1605367 RepID=UPI0026F24EC6|nr:RAMP superfamily CRISPR-associated protein [Jiulongibacter sediminis]